MLVTLTALALYDLHKNWAWFVIIGNGLAGVWSLLAHKYTVLRTRALWWFIGLAEVAIFVQVAMGVALVIKIVFGVCIDAVFGMLGGLLGVALFKKKDLPPPGTTEVLPPA